MQKNNTKQHQLGKRINQQHATQQHPCHNVGSKADDRNQSRTHPKRRISRSMLDSVSAFMSCNGSSSNTVTVINRFTQIDGLVCRIIMIRQCPGVEITFTS